MKLTLQGEFDMKLTLEGEFDMKLTLQDEFDITLRTCPRENHAESQKCNTCQITDFAQTLHVYTVWWDMWTCKISRLEIIYFQRYGGLNVQGQFEPPELPILYTFHSSAAFEIHAQMNSNLGYLLPRSSSIR